MGVELVDAGIKRAEKKSRSLTGTKKRNYKPPRPSTSVYDHIGDPKRIGGRKKPRIKEEHLMMGKLNGSWRKCIKKIAGV